MEISNEFKERSKEALTRGVLYGFCPKHLVIEGRKDLWVFPFNILFMSFRGEPDGSQTSGSAVYDPDLSTCIQNKEEWSMTYRNQYGGNSCVVIAITTADLSYKGVKFVNGIEVGSGYGKIKEINGVEKGWEMFFFHLTMLGLKNGEQCKFEKVTGRKDTTS